MKIIYHSLRFQCIPLDIKFCRDALSDVVHKEKVVVFRVLKRTARNVYSLLPDLWISVKKWKSEGLFQLFNFCAGLWPKFFKPKPFKSFAVEKYRQKKPGICSLRMLDSLMFFSFSCKHDKQTRDTCDSCLPPSP